MKGWINQNERYHCIHVLIFPQQEILIFSWSSITNVTSTHSHIWFSLISRISPRFLYRFIHIRRKKPISLFFDSSQTIHVTSWHHKCESLKLMHSTISGSMDLPLTAYASSSLVFIKLGFLHSNQIMSLAYKYTKWRLLSQMLPRFTSLGPSFSYFMTYFLQCY